MSKSSKTFVAWSAWDNARYETSSTKPCNKLIYEKMCIFSLNVIQLFVVKL